MSANRVIADLVGTFKTAFQIGKGGPKLKNNAGTLESRNAADAAYANFMAALITAQTLSVQADGLVLNSDAASAGADWKVTLQRAATGMTHDLTFVFPAGDPSVGQAITVASFAGNVVTLQYTNMGGGSNNGVIDTTALAFGTASPLTMLTIPANAQITRLAVYVDTAFNGTAPTLSVGITGTTSKYSGTGDVDLKTIGLYELDPAMIPVGSTENVIATYVADGSSAGAGRIVVEYAVPS